jgi:hypothetical protein
MALTHMELAQRALGDADFVVAAAQAEAAVRRYESIADHGGTADAQSTLATASLRLGEHARARELYRLCLPAHRDQLARGWLPWDLMGAALMAAAAGRHAAALRLGGAAAGLRRWTAYIPPGSDGDPERAAALERARMALGAEAATAAEVEGRAMTLDRAVAYALAEVSAESPTDDRPVPMPTRPADP